MWSEIVRKLEEGAVGGKKKRGKKESNQFYLFFFFFFPRLSKKPKSFRNAIVANNEFCHFSLSLILCFRKIMVGGSHTSLSFSIRFSFSIIKFHVGDAERERERERERGYSLDCNRDKSTCGPERERKGFLSLIFKGLCHSLLGRFITWVFGFVCLSPPRIHNVLKVVKKEKEKRVILP